MLFRMHQHGFALDAHALGGFLDRHLEIAEFIHQLERKRLPPGPNSAIGNFLDLIHLQLAAIGNRLNELLVHVINESLKINLLFRRHLARGIAGIFQRAGFKSNVFQLCPFQQVFVIQPLRNHSNAAHNAGRIGVNFVRAGSYVVSAAGAHRFD